MRSLGYAGVAPGDLQGPDIKWTPQVCMAAGSGNQLRPHPGPWTAGSGGEFQPWRPQGKHSERSVRPGSHPAGTEIEKEFQEFTGRSKEEK